MIYDVVLADPCWAYRNVKTGGSHTSGAAQKYPVMTTRQIGDLPIDELAAKDAACFLWATTPLGVDPYWVLDQWGFKFKTKWYWHKTGRKGTGYWTRGCVEEVLIGIRGNVKAWRSNLDNWIEGGDGLTIESTPEGHSKKPKAVRDMIETLTPGARRVELFATEKARMWDSYGLALDPSHDFLSEEFWHNLLAEEAVA